MTERHGLEIGEDPIDHLVLSVDTSDINELGELVDGFRKAGGSIVKFGTLSQSSFGGPEGLSDLAQELDVRWIYDGKAHDIGNTMVDTIKKIMSYDYPPSALTMHYTPNQATMRQTQEAARHVPVFGVTLLTNISPEDAYYEFGNDDDHLRVHRGEMTIEEMGEIVRLRVVQYRAKQMRNADVKGLVASSKEVGPLYDRIIIRNIPKLIPGTRSKHAVAHDQENVGTPEEAMANGADFLVIGRQYIEAEDRERELALIREEVARGLERRVS